MNTEVVWVDAARAGDEGAFGRLVEQYQRPVYTLCLRMLGTPTEAEDAAQETFLKAYRALDRYDRQRPFATWLLAIASHHCIDRLRRRHIAEISLDDLPPWRWLHANTPDPEEAALRAMEDDEVAALLTRLTDDYRLVLILRYWYDLGYAEIATLLGETESAVKSRLHRARRTLAEGMEPRLETPGRARVPAGAPERGEMTWVVAQPTS
jgi:RNA polymerase sigma-70 factor (ECF subfamily)